MKKTIMYLTYFLLLNNALAQNELNIYDWDGYYNPELIKSFEESHQIKVKHNIISNDSELLNAINSNEDVDVIVSPHYLLPIFMQNDNIHKLNHKKLPNHSNLNTHLLMKLATINDANDYVVPYVGGLSLIVLDKNKARNALGDDFPKSWGLLFDEKYASKLATCGIGIFDAPLQFYGAHMLYKAQFLLSAELINDITDELIKLKPYYQIIGNEQVVQDFSQGKLCATFAGSSFIHNMGSSDNLELLIPEEGATMYMDVMFIPVKAKNIENAYKFINFMLEPQNAAKLVATSSGIPAVNGVKNLVEAKYANNSLIFPEDKTLFRMYLDSTLNEQQEYTLNKSWHKIINQ